MIVRASLAVAFSLYLSATVFAETKLVSWNVSPQLLEGTRTRAEDMKALNDALNPDVLVLIEVAGLEEAKVLASNLGWSKYYLAVSSWARMSTNVYFALETAVVSKVPIERVVEIDASPDGTHQVIDETGVELSVPVTEVKADTHGVSGVSPLARTDRVSLRVDLSNGLSIFPVHLKSNRNSACATAGEINSQLRKIGLPEISTIANMLRSGFPESTKEHVANAAKRERVIAAVKLEADKAVSEGRDVIIAGDFNTSFEPGKVGKSFNDCTLQEFSCDKAPFPAEACSNGDGYDDTFAILTASLVGSQKWSVLTDGLGRTYDDDHFADRAIDHLAVPIDQAGKFTGVDKGDAVFGSDHFPIFVTYR